jgi:hypothetical protein
MTAAAKAENTGTRYRIQLNPAEAEYVPSANSEHVPIFSHFAPLPNQEKL